ncbi:class I SAM-dependent methyltransferase [Nonomuraea sp. NPDC049714]|uniref:class I SAM-dependent methyltransferase n=1 Tax=Nonomuraea sp. NPDC049714 TaxID=3364357 RepID=UPI00378D7EDB
MDSINNFYDPHLYDLNVGHAPRVGPTYHKYTSELAPGSRVLELGCGTGDTLLPLARHGFDVIGLDSSPTMLARLSDHLEKESPDVRARVRLQQEELPRLPDLGTVDAVLLPNDFIGHMLSDDLLNELAANVRTVIKTGGTVLLDASRFDVVFLGSITGTEGGLTRTHGSFPYPGDRTLRVGEQSEYDGLGIIQSTFRYELLDPAGFVERTWYRTLRMYPRRLREVTATLELNGFAITQVDPAAFPPGLDHIFISAAAV